VESDQFALSESRGGRGEEDRGVLIRVGRTDERHHLLRREDLDVGLRRGERLVDVGDGVGREAIELASPLHGAVEDRDGFLARSVGHVAVRPSKRKT
jgi:hypothetical protein